MAAKKNMGTYWDDIILTWEESSYEKKVKSPDFLEGLAAHFRQHIIDRQDTCLKYLKNHIVGKTVLEIGSATGSTCFALSQMGAKRVIGTDISPRAIERANTMARQKGISKEKLEFFVTGVGEKIPTDEKVDMMIGLGILEYVESAFLRNFVQKLKAPQLFLSFDELRFTPQKIIHFFYRNIRQIPYYKQYTQDEIKELFAELGYNNLRTFRDRKNAFITNF